MPSSLVITSFLPLPSPTVTSTSTDRLWRWVITDLDGATLSIMDHLASGRQVTRRLTAPSEMTCTVPSDSFEINLLHTDGEPFLSEGNRLLYGFRRESDTQPFWVIRASGIVMQVEDTVETDIATTRVTAYDAWQYLYHLPVLQSTGPLGHPCTTKAKDRITSTTAGRLLPSEGMIYPAGTPTNEVLIDVLNNTLGFAFEDGTPPAGALFGFINQLCFPGNCPTIEECPPLDADYLIEQGTMVGQVFEEIVQAGFLDVVFEPMYDPVSCPGQISSLNIYAPPRGAAGSEANANGFNYGAIFSWDRPARNVVGLNRLEEGTERANEIQYFNGQGGSPVFSSGLRPFFYEPSIAKFGPYWAEQFFPSKVTGKQGRVAITATAQNELNLRRDRKTTVAVSPAPEFSPEPFIDYDLGDRVHIFAGLDFNPDGPTPPSTTTQPVNLLPNQFRKRLDGWQRVVEIPIDIDDNGVETVRQLVVGPAADLPPAESNLAVNFQNAAAQASSSSSTRRVGSVQASRP